MRAATTEPLTAAPPVVELPREHDPAHVPSSVPNASEAVAPRAPSSAAALDPLADQK